MRGDLCRGAGHRRIGALRSLCWAFTLGTLLAGCYSNIPVAQPGQVSSGAMVRVQLTLDGSRDLERQLGSEVRSVFGRVDAVRADTLYLFLQESRTISGSILPALGETRVALPRGLIAGITERVHNKRRSLVAASLVIAGAVALLVIAAGAIGGGGGNGTPTPPPPPT